MVSATTINVLLADDHEMVRESLAAQINARDGLSVVGQASCGVDTVRLCEELQPDVLVLDYALGDLTGTTVINRLKALGSPARVLVLSHHESIQYAERTLHAGARGYLIKSGSIDELVVAIHEVHGGGSYICRALDGAVAETIGSRRSKSGLDLLSQREFELLGHVGDGLTIQEASQRMHVSESTASTYRSRLMKKLNLQKTAEIIRYAIEHKVSNSGRPLSDDRRAPGPESGSSGEAPRPHDGSHDQEHNLNG